jgi:hypothetical protein
MRSAYIISVGKPEGKRPLGIPRYRWQVNIKLNLRDIVLEGVNWIVWLRIGTTGRLL